MSLRTAGGDAISYIFNNFDPTDAFMQEKKVIKEEKMKQEEKYMWAVVDGVKEKVNLPLVYIVLRFKVFMSCFDHMK